MPAPHPTAPNGLPKVLLVAPSIGNAMGPLVAVMAAELAKSVPLSLLVPAHFALPVAGVNIVRYPSGAGKLARLAAMLNPKLWLHLWRVLTTERPTLVHLFNSEGYPVSLLLGLFCRLRGVPFVVSIHDPEHHPGSLLDAVNVGLGRITRHMANALQIFSPRFTPVLAKQGLGHKPLVVIPHGNMAAQYLPYRQAGVAREDMVLLFGRMEPYKGLGTLVACADYLPPQLKICVAGSGPIAPELLATIAVNPNRFELHNRYITDAEVAHFMQRAAVLALPYTHVTQSSLPLIGAEFGLPVVGSALGAFVDDIPAVGGLLVPPNDPETLAKALVKALKLTPRIPPEASYAFLREAYAAWYKSLLK